MLRAVGVFCSPCSCYRLKRLRDGVQMTLNQPLATLREDRATAGSVVRSDVQLDDVRTVWRPANSHDAMNPAEWLAHP